MMQAGLLIVAAAFITSILSGVFGMAGGLVFMGVLAWMLPVTTALALHGVIQFTSNRISDAHFRTSRRWIVTAIGATFLFQAIQIALA